MEYEMFEDIIHNIDIDEVPLEFIRMAKVIHADGSQELLRDEADLERVIRGPERQKLRGFNVILNVTKLRNAMISQINIIYDEMNRLCNEEVQREIDEIIIDLTGKKDTDI